MLGLVAWPGHVAAGIDTVRAGSVSSSPDAAAKPPVASTPAASSPIRSFVIARLSSLWSWNEVPRSPSKRKPREGNVAVKPS
ncbi:MAG: hypothetical protein ABIR67_12765 [Gaiellaceae bacterium]